MANASSSSDQGHKVWVCKYVGTPGEDERLQTGQNPIPVAASSIEHNHWNGVVPGWFSDRHDRSFVLAYKTDENTSDDPPPKYIGEPQCPAPQEPKLAHLTLVKSVKGSDANPSAWTLIADGPTDFHGYAPVTHEVKAGDYSLSESGPSGYKASDWNCGDAKMSGGHKVTVKDKDVTCTITNTFKPPETQLAHLTLVKVVKGSDAKPSAWTLIADGPTDFHGYAPVTHEVKAGDYSLSESGPSGYEASDWKCGDAKMSGGHKVTVKDEDVTCTITNTFKHSETHKAQLKLVKEVVNTGGGTAKATAWTLDATGPTPFAEGQSGVHHEVAEGTYTLSESGPSGYTASDWKCRKDDDEDLSLNRTSTMETKNTVKIKDDDVTCTITNTFVPPGTPGTPSTPGTPAIVVDKTATLNDVTSAGHTAGKADAGETISYSFLVTNTGNVTLTDIKASDPLLDLVVAGTAVTCSPTTLIPGASATCTAAAYTVTASDVADGQPVVNVVVASGLPPTGSRVAATDEVRTPTAKPKEAVVAPTVITPVPEVAGVVKTAPVKAAPAPTTLAFTGSETVPLGLSGLLVLVLGAVLTVASRRQRPKQARE